MAHELADGRYCDGPEQALGHVLAYGSAGCPTHNVAGSIENEHTTHAWNGRVEPHRVRARPTTSELVTPRLFSVDVDGDGLTLPPVRVCRVCEHICQGLKKLDVCCSFAVLPQQEWCTVCIGS